MASSLDLATRSGLPEALKVLLAEYPRDIWQSHNNFDGLVAFWLDRHLMFRRLMANLLADSEATADGKMDPQRHASRLSHLGGMLLNQLHGHHQIEDHHYFPKLVTLDTRLEAGFDLLDADHHALDGLLDRFARGANGVIGGTVEVMRFREELLSFEALLDRHLNDEEDLIVPVILDRGPDQIG